MNLWSLFVLWVASCPAWAAVLFALLLALLVVVVVGACRATWLEGRKPWH